MVKGKTLVPEEDLDMEAPTPTVTKTDEDGLPTEPVEGHAEGGDTGAKGGLGHGGANSALQ